MTGREGLVVRVDARQCEVAIDGDGAPDGPVQPALLRGRLFEEATEDKVPVAVGDRVRLSLEGDELAIDEVLPRRNVFARRTAGEDVRRQLLAANVDQIVVVASFGNPPFSSIATDRILVAASFCDVPAAVVLNKSDRAKRKLLEAIPPTYEGAGYPVLLTSALEGTGIEELTELLCGKVSVLYGLSGVGKSSLLNRVEPGLGLRTREVSKSLKSGRHTTTFARLYRLRIGGAVIDTPGVRTFRPYGLPPNELRLHLPEMATLGRDCRFPTCSHRDEPDCAVRAALERGEIPDSRYRSYLTILEELESVYGGTGRAPE